MTHVRSLALSALAFSMCATAALAQERQGTSFVEEFDAGLDRSFWYISDGWTNGAHQNCGWGREEVSVRDGKLILGFSRNEKAGESYRCGEVQTVPVFGQGTYETRVKTPAGSGLNANMFTYIGEVHGKPHDEIDFEFLLKDTSQVQLNVYKDGVGNNEHLTPLTPASDEAFRDYAFVWGPDSIEWYIDGELVHRLDDPSKLPGNDTKIYLSLWSTDTLTSWLGPFEEPDGPLEMEVERVSFTALGDECQYPDSLVCKQAPGE
ncbi:family 16 glycosylhydrolase [Aureimonas mangrovi]|uniref:family 16 glycosylhydrolase n=1 Tax=Aureimonas mangrovi TaxID=2758041 RepID=UPI001FE900E1|nr:family 16 glycosylhydrolase [Aureimonas mangrovi]